MKQLESKADLKELIDLFYSKAVQDPILGPFFIAVNFEKHLPRMNQFWAFILFDEAGYTTNLTEAHAHLKLSKELLNRWVNLFHATVDANFEGQKAELAKQKASLIGWTMGSKLDN